MVVGRRAMTHGRVARTWWSQSGGPGTDAVDSTSPPDWFLTQSWERKPILARYRGGAACGTAGRGGREPGGNGGDDQAQLPPEQSMTECRPGWRHLKPCEPTASGSCACGCRPREYWCVEDEACERPGCAHRLYYHLNGSCWHDEDCTCNEQGRINHSPDGYLAEEDMLKMVADW